VTFHPKSVVSKDVNTPVWGLSAYEPPNPGIDEIHPLRLVVV